MAAPKFAPGRREETTWGGKGKVSWSSEEKKEGKNSETWADDLLGEKDNPGSCTTAVAHFSGTKIHQFFKIVQQESDLKKRTRAKCFLEFLY